jgi:putative Mg2+ transporter-C (MgtC) family protein
MPITLSWSEIVMRLLYTVAAGALIGMNRSEHGRAAGLRTSILVALAACIAMLQVNLLLPLAGRPSDSFVMNDLMRLPLGILSGMGFIGAGAIVRRGNFVVGVTTAATMWFLTVIEDRMKQDRQGKLLVVTGLIGPGEDEIRAILQNGGFRISSCAFATEIGAGSRGLSCDLQWRARPYDTKVPEAVNQLTARDGVLRVAWAPQAK